MRKLIVLICVGLLCAASGNAFAGLVTHLEFEGDTTDSTGNITYTGTPGAYVPGPAGFGQAMDFDPASSTAVYAEGVGPALSTIGNQSTIAFWAFGQTDLSNPTVAFSANDPVNWSRVSLQLPWNNEYVFYDTWGPTGTQDRIARYAGDDPNQYNGQWNHWAFVKDTTLDDSSPANSRVKIYLNGSLWRASSDYYDIGDGSQSLAGIENIYIGAEKQYWYFYDGMLDDFRIYDEALGQDDVSALMVPEPATLCLLGLGGLLLIRRRK